MIELAGMGGIYMAYTQVAQTTKPGKVEPIFPSGLWLILIITVLILVVSILQMFLLPKLKKGTKFEMPTKSGFS